MSDWKDRKLTQAWGDDTAQRLWNSFMARHDIDWQGKSFFDFGCSWGYLGKYLIEHQGVAQAWGVDVDPQWTQMRDGFDPLSVPGMHLHAGDVLEIAELQEQRFDVIWSSGTLMLIPPTGAHEILRWFFDHLNVGGSCLLNVRTFLSQYGGDLQSYLRTPLPHLLFDKRSLDRYLVAVGKPRSRYMNPSCAATWLMQFRRVGFEIVHAERSPNQIDESVYERHADKLSTYEPSELRTSILNVRLRKPPPADLSELRPPAR